MNQEKKNKTNRILKKIFKLAELSFRLVSDLVEKANGLLVIKALAATGMISCCRLWWRSPFSSQMQCLDKSKPGTRASSHNESLHFRRALPSVLLFIGSLLYRGLVAFVRSHCARTHWPPKRLVGFDFVNDIGRF